MTALQLVECLFREDESPKKAFRLMQATLKRVPRPDQVRYEVEADWEQDETPEAYFPTPEDAAFAREQIENGNVWGWCTVHVTAKWTDPDDNVWQGNDYLGACSYLSREDFMQPGDYYDDMKAAAYDGLVAALVKAGFKQL